MTFKITIVTPAYNRGKELVVLYDSIVSQNYPSIEWIVVDDGSTDDTLTILNNLSSQKKIAIKVFSKVNGGKLSAQHVAYFNLSSDWFFVVDSDDWLYENSLHMMNSILVDFSEYYDSFLFNRIDPDSQQVIGSTFSSNFNNYFEVLNHVKGDKVHLLRSSFFKSFEPVIDRSEKYISVNQIYLSIADTYKVKCFNLPMVYCRYMSSGLTKNLIGHRRSSPNNSRYTYLKLASNPRINLLVRAHAKINYYRFSFPTFLKPFSILELPLWLAGLLYYMWDSFVLRDLD
jgi:glycosyltransferase involved in cell wall biosynthesis